MTAPVEDERGLCWVCGGLGRVAVADAENGPEWDAVDFCACAAGAREREEDSETCIKSEHEKPDCRLVGTDGNVYAVIANVRRCLWRAEQGERAREWVHRATRCRAYDEVLRLLHEYVSPE